MAGMSLEDFMKPVEVPTAPTKPTGFSIEQFMQGGDAFDQSIRQQTTPGALIWEGVKDIFNPPTRSGPPLAAPQQMGSTPGGAATYYGKTGRRTTPIMPLDERIRQAGGGDFTTLPGLGKTVTGAAANLVDMIPGMISQIGGSGFVEPAARTGAMAAGADAATADDIARLQREGMFPAEIFAPWSKVAEHLGPEAELAYHSNPVAWVFGLIGKGVEHGAAKAGEASGLPPGVFANMADAFMGWAGARGVKGSLQKSFAERGTRAEQKAAADAADAAKADAAYQDTAQPTEAPPPPNYPGAAAVDITTRGQVYEMFNRAKKAGTEEGRLAKQVEEITAKPDELFAKAARPLTPAEAIAASKARIAAIRAAKTGEEIGAQAGQVPKTRIAETPIVGEASTTLMDAQAKVARGERAMLTSEERIQLEGVERGKRAAQAGPDVIDQKLIALLSGTALVGAGLLGADEAMAAGDGSEGGGSLLAAVAAAGLGGKVLAKGKVVEGKTRIAPRIVDEPNVIARAVAGDPAAFAIIHKSVVPRLEKVLTRFTRDPARAQDLVQETMLSVHQHLAEFKGDSALNTWIYRIGLNKAKNDAIAQGRRISEVEMSDALAETVEERVAGKTLTPEQELQNKQLGARLQEALDSLSPERRELFEMYEMEGLSYELISQKLNKPIGTIRSGLSRIRDSLQDFLKGERGRVATGVIGAGAVGALAAANLPENSDTAVGLIAAAAGVMKVKGEPASWHPKVLEDLSAPLKGSRVETEPLLLYLRRMDAEGIPNQVALSVRAAAEAESNWADRAIKNYLNKHAATATDPIADVQIPYGEGTKSWGELMDKATIADKASWHKNVAKNEAFFKVPDNENVFSFDPYDQSAVVAKNQIKHYLSHVGDYLREHVSPEKLQSYDLTRAVKETAKWDAELAKKMNDARLNDMKDATIYKAYSKEGMAWVELNKPGQFARESDAMGHSVRGYEPEGPMNTRGGISAVEPHPDWIPASGNSGYSSYGHGGWEGIKNGYAQVLSLRDLKTGESHATVEISRNPKPLKAFNETGEEAAITQIKGKQNRAPSEKYLPFIQDLVKSGNWGDVGDLGNTGLIDLNSIGTFSNATRVKDLQDIINKHGRYVTKDIMDKLFNSTDHPSGEGTIYFPHQRGRADIGMTGALGAGAVGALAVTALSEDSGAAEAGAGYVASLLASFFLQGKNRIPKSFYPRIGLNKETGAVKGPGGYFPKETIEKIAKPFVKGIDIRQDMADIPNLRERPKAEQIAIAEKMFADKAAAPYRMVTNWLNKYAGTAKDPLNDMMLPVTVRDPVTYEVTGSVLKRWEDLIDTVLVKKPPTSFAQPMPGGFNAYPSFKELPLNEVSWGFGEQTTYPKADPRVNFADYEAERAARVDYSTRKGEVDYRERSAAQSAIDDFLTHAGDYYETIPEAKRANYDLPRLLKEVAADDIKKAKEAASYKVEAAKARQESVAPDNPDVVKRFDPVELPERTLHRNEAGGESASRLVEETLPASKEQFSIVKLTKAGQFFDEGRFMGHSVGGYDLREGMPGWTAKSGRAKENRYASDSYGHGGWEAIQSGYAEVYSLRDAKGNSYATFEVKTGDTFQGEKPQAELTQMKGPGNRAVSPEAQRYAQDFVTDPKWTEINGNDLGKIGLTRSEWKARRDAKDAESGMMDYYPEDGHKTPFIYEAGSGWANPETNMIDLPPGRYSKEDLHKAHIRAGYVIDPRFLRAADVPILERAGTPVTEAMKEQARQYQGEEISGFSNRQRGAADPRFLAAVAAGTVSALALSNYFSDSPEEISGALGAGILGARGSKAARFARDGIAPVGKGLDYLLGSVSTRLGNLAPELKLRAREFERKSLERLGQAQAEIYPFLKALNKLPTAQKESLNAALLDGTPGVVAEAIKGDPVLVDGWRKVQNLLGEFRDEHVAAGRFKKGLTDYFPRVVKDLKGLMEALGETERSSLDIALAKASAKMLKEQQRPLTDVEESIVVRNSLLAEPATSQQAGYAKRRGIEMEDKLQQFYEKPTDSLLRYVSAAVHDLETSKFFGKDLKTTKAGTGEFTNVEGSIAEMVTRMRQEGKLTREGEIDLRNILKARFIGGEQSMTGWLQDVRNTSNAALLGSLHSAATQIGDTIATIYHHGFLPTLQATKQKLTGDSQVSAKEFNLVNHVAEEMGTARWSGELQRQVLKLGFGAIDQFAKGLGLNASLLKNQRLARTTKGQAQLAEKYQQAYGDEFGQLVADLKAGRKTELTKSLIWSELSDAQPISKMEMPEAYLNHPNGRMLYQMKTYMLKQMDIIRRDGFQEIAKGNYVKGAKALVGLATYLTLANIPGDIIKDLLSGRPIELDNIDYVENLLKNFGINRYTMDKLSGNRPFKGGWEAAMGYVTPVAGGIISSLDEPAKLVKYVPAVGRGVYDRYLGGNEKAAAADNLRARVDARDRAEAASPQLKVERMQRNKERAAERAAK